MRKLRINETSGLLTEDEVKAKVLSRLRSEGRICRKSIIANEWSVPNSTVRADLAIFAGHFIGIEVKSARDTLRRLHRQLPVYGLTFEQVLLVLASRHCKIINFGPFPGIEVWEIDSSGKICMVQSPRLEKVPVLEQCHLSMNQRSHFRRANGIKPDSEIVSGFCARYRDTSARFWKEVGRRQIQSEHLLALSRFRDKRESLAAWQSEKVRRWQAWNEQIAAERAITHEAA